MELEELKEQISIRTGIPTSLLTGDSEKGILNQARALMAYKAEGEKERQKSTSEQFSEWFKAVSGNEDPEASDPLSDIAEQVRVDSGEFPVISDTGEVNMGSHKSASEELADFIKRKAVFDPFKHDGWKTMK